MAFLTLFIVSISYIGVDIVLGGHEHIYERYWPIYNFQVFIIILLLFILTILDFITCSDITTFNSIKVKNGSYEEPYTDPGAPVHIVTGAAVSMYNRSWYNNY